MKGSDQVWAWVGKIALVLTTVVAIITIITYLSKDYKLKANGDFAPIILPDQIYKNLYIFDYCYDNFNKFLEPTTLKDYIDNEIESNVTNPDNQEVKLTQNQIESLYLKLSKQMCNEIEKKLSDV